MGHRYHCTMHTAHTQRDEGRSPDKDPGPYGPPYRPPVLLRLVLRDPVVDGNVLIGVEGRAGRLGVLDLALVLVLVLRAGAASAAGSIAAVLDVELDVLEVVAGHVEVEVE